MTIPAPLPMIPAAPDEYSKQYMESVLQAITLHLRALNSAGNITTGTIVATQLPVSAVGLPVGTLWNDAGTVKIIT